MKAPALGQEFAALTPQPLSAMHVLRLARDDGVSVAELARFIEADPALSARVMRLANSPYYGLSRKVSSASRAVILLGFSAVRALAVSAAFGLLTERAEVGPTEFWAHSVVTAIVASAIARRVGFTQDAAFSAGLLHDMGLVVAAADTDLRADHASTGSLVLDNWSFPPQFVRAIAHHHDQPEDTGDTLGRILIAAESLSMMVADPIAHDDRSTPSAKRWTRSRFRRIAPRGWSPTWLARCAVSPASWPGHRDKKGEDRRTRGTGRV